MDADAGGVEPEVSDNEDGSESDSDGPENDDSPGAGPGGAAGSGGDLVEPDLQSPGPPRCLCVKGFV